MNQDGLLIDNKSLNFLSSGGGSIFRHKNGTPEIPTTAEISSNGGEETHNIEVSRKRKKELFAAKIAFVNTDEVRDEKIHDKVINYKRRKGYDIDESDLYKNNSQKIVSFYGHNFDYNTDTSDEENKYIDYKNKRFYRLSLKQ